MNSYVKRILCALIAAVLAFACVACGGGSDKEESKQNASAEPASDPAGESKAPEQGSIDLEGFSYRNESLGIGIKLDESWSIRTTEELAALVGATSLGDAMKNAPITYDFYAVRPISSASINIIFENMTKSVGKAFTESEYLDLAKTTVKAQVESAGMKVNSLEIIKRTVAGRELNGYAIELFANGITVHEYCLLIRMGDYMANITLASGNAEELEQLLNAIYPLG